MYIFDTSSFIEIFKFYPKRFPSLWKAFDSLISNGEVVSVKEVYKEVFERGDSLSKWSDSQKHIFSEPSVEEALFIQDIFKIKHFQQSIEHKKRLKGGAFADPFVVARAKKMAGVVVTQEQKKPNSAKIPNICDHFTIKCINFEIFMETENWEF